MKAYTNKTDRIDARKCLYAEINKGHKATKKTVRQASKKLIKKEL